MVNKSVLDLSDNPSNLQRNVTFQKTLTIVGLLRQLEQHKTMGNWDYFRLFYWYIHQISYGGKYISELLVHKRDSCVWTYIIYI